MMGFNNIELISDRPLALNLQEIRECIRLFPDRAMIVSLMADNDRNSWHELIRKVEGVGVHALATPLVTKADGIPHSRLDLSVQAKGPLAHPIAYLSANLTERSQLSPFCDRGDS